MTDATLATAESPEYLKDQGLKLFFDGQYPLSIAHFERARDGFLAHGDQAQAGEMLNNLGVVYQKIGRWNEATRVLGDARTLFARLGDAGREAQAVGNLGSLHVAHGDRKRGLGLLQEAAEMFRMLGEREMQSATLRALSRAYFGRADMSHALSYYEAALAVLEHPSTRDRALRGLLSVPSRMLGRGA
jgi:tetratricopeptide (TPR) repeat protein